MINWKVRFQNPVFWAQIAVAVISPILVGLGMQWQDMTTWAALGGVKAAAVWPVRAEKAPLPVLPYH